jgi:hypothetical protein
MKKSGVVSKKVFKLFKKELQRGSYQFQKKFSFENRTTRKYYRGLHKLELIINGDSAIIEEFMVI